MKKTFLIVLLKVIMLTGCSKAGSENNNPGPTPASVEKNRIKGRVTDHNGNPIAGVTIVIEHTLYYASYLYAMTDANGNYACNVPNGSWKASAQMQKQFLGQPYNFDLHPDVAEPFSGTDGAVRNFTWKLNGSKPGGGYYGSIVAAYAQPGAVIMMNDVELTLTPNGPLANGTNGQVITKTLTDVGGGEDGIADVPLGKYTIRATVKSSGQSLQIRLRNTGTYSNSMEAIFQPYYTSSTHYKITVEVK